MAIIIKPLPDIWKLHSFFDLDDETGNLVYRFSVARAVSPGQIAGTVNNGYRNVSISGRRYLAHRIVFKMAYGREPIGLVDHIDGDKLNNRPSNLREATRSQNQWNGAAYRTNSTGFKGVRVDKRSGYFTASIRADGKRFNLGTFATAEQAHAAYCEAAQKLHGDFARVA